MLVINTFYSMAEPGHCNRCGHPLDFWDLQEDLSIHKEKLGYGTKHDGDSVHLRLCCACFDKFVDECVVNPVTECESSAD